jgi:hypothetical protein
MTRLLALLACLLGVVTIANAQPPGADPIAEHVFPPELVMRHSGDLALDERQRSAIKEAVQKAQARFTDLQFIAFLRRRAGLAQQALEHRLRHRLGEAGIEGRIPPCPRIVVAPCGQRDDRHRRAHASRNLRKRRPWQRSSRALEEADMQDAVAGSGGDSVTSPGVDDTLGERTCSRTSDRPGPWSGHRPDRYGASDPAAGGGPRAWVHRLYNAR